MTNEKDIEQQWFVIPDGDRHIVAEGPGRRILAFLDEANARQVVKRHNAALTTARKEERQAAFKVICVDCAEGDTPLLDEQARWYYHGEGNDAVGCSASKLRLEAAATKGGSDG